MSDFLLQRLQNAAGKYVRFMAAVNRVMGGVAMYLLLVMLAILMYSAACNNLAGSPPIWAMEMAQFTMAAYYLLGASYSLQQGAHVRMDFLYERWKPRQRAAVDSITILFVIFYLGVLVYGGVQGSWYALEYGQRNHSVWGPYMAPIKIIMTLGMSLMLLQCVAELLKDIARTRGVDLMRIPPPPEPVAASIPEMFLPAFARAEASAD
ncbi:MAG: TRAP transporter small permease subunit [Zoogloeaceae bacterium]|jgi:TRAP-type mannitol/chloroaromatic compound transport system permease small subunit|nr:TRAP transporter small permease subunit [Zoogloeaceae bacterium]